MIFNALTSVNIWQRKIIILFFICKSYVIINALTSVAIKNARGSPFLRYFPILDWHNHILIDVHTSQNFHQYIIISQ